jgi:hypothetical protein
LNVSSVSGNCFNHLTFINDSFSHISPIFIWSILINGSLQRSNRSDSRNVSWNLSGRVFLTNNISRFFLFFFGLIV